MTSHSNSWNTHCSPTSLHRVNPVRVAALAAFVAVIIFNSAPARAVTLFHETFDGYWSFPAEEPQYDPINPGLALKSEGADEFWYGGRFEPGDNGSINSDLAVQKYGGSGNSSHTGRAEDDAGMLFNVSTLNLESVVLRFKWRTFMAGHGDKFRAGYFVGDIDFGNSRFKNFVAEYGTDWWEDEWTEVASGRSDSWQHVAVPLPLSEPSVWVAFWMDGGKYDYAKFDHIKVKGMEVVPEPSSALIAAIGAALCGGIALRRRGRKSRARDAR